MAEIVQEGFKHVAWPHLVRIPLIRLGPELDQLREWLERPEIPGRCSWDWYVLNNVTMLIAGFDDQNAAFEFKMRWG